MTILIRRCNRSIIDIGFRLEQPLDHGEMTALCRRLEGRPAMPSRSSSIDVGFRLEQPFDYG
jgi:hypothetical protein